MECSEWFIWLLFGHLFGDYVFQNHWMALNKKKYPIVAMIHCLLYAFIVVVFLDIGGYEIVWYHMTLIYFSHLILDGTHLVEWWMKFYKIRSWDTRLKNGKSQTVSNRTFKKSATVEDSINIAFGAFVYIVVDNTLHLFMMFLILKYLGV